MNCFYQKAVYFRQGNLMWVVIDAPWLHHIERSSNRIYLIYVWLDNALKWNLTVIDDKENWGTFFYLFTEIPMILGSHIGLMRKIKEKKWWSRGHCQEFSKIETSKYQDEDQYYKGKKKKKKRKRKTKNGCTSERIHIIYYLTNLLLLGQEKEFL